MNVWAGTGFSETIEGHRLSVRRHSIKRAHHLANSAASQFRAAIMRSQDASTGGRRRATPRRRAAEGADADGFAVDVAHNGTGGIWWRGNTPTPRSCSTSCCPAPTATRCAHVARRAQLDANPDADRQERRVGRGGGPRHRRRRLSHQAVLVCGAGGPPACAAPRRGPAPAQLTMRRPPAGPGDAAGVASRQTDRAHPPRVRGPRVPAAAIPTRCCRNATSLTTFGISSSTAIPISSRCTSADCAPSCGDLMTVC